jgi:hypothetical protein
LYTNLALDSDGSPLTPGRDDGDNLIGPIFFSRFMAYSFLISIRQRLTDVKRGGRALEMTVKLIERRTLGVGQIE